MDISVKLNKLNKKHQGKNKLIVEYYQDIKAFHAKRKLYENQMKSNNSIHFPLLLHYCTKYNSGIIKRLGHWNNCTAVVWKYIEKVRV